MNELPLQHAIKYGKDQLRSTSYIAQCGHHPSPLSLIRAMCCFLPDSLYLISPDHLSKHVRCLLCHLHGLWQTATGSPYGFARFMSRRCRWVSTKRKQSQPGKSQCFQEQQGYVTFASPTVCDLTILVSHLFCSTDVVCSEIVLLSRKIALTHTPSTSYAVHCSHFHKVAHHVLGVMLFYMTTQCHGRFE